ncbi:DUF456 domain-containing protein [Ornithinimicrobium pekingense]|uniref:DUF456 domain-containing protein n=1 Tax=Ornithinimicrobium pekingense TaxID=384677 RepID=A0ABQ2F7I6_9MICO|nr:DUF456 domain-containing protein [Ornithinimicrobium pekingense]GGK69578.1 hypothetical protein GCM10011509_17460 [Ornithinimicrobium pekingense]
MSLMEIVVALLMVLGVVGIVVPVLPGLIVIVGAVLLWALEERSTTGWVVLAVVVALYLAGLVLQWLVPGKRMRRAGVSTSTLLAGVAAAVVGAFVIPVVGLFVGFPVGIFLVSLARTRDRREAVRATGHALKAVGVNILVELATAFTIIAVWAVAVLFLT